MHLNHSIRSGDVTRANSLSRFVEVLSIRVVLSLVEGLLEAPQSHQFDQTYKESRAHDKQRLPRRFPAKPKVTTYSSKKVLD
jgi:hypothetical protein